MSFKAYVQIAFPPSPTKLENYWLQIDEFWLSLSKKFDKPPTYLFPIQIESLQSAGQETQKQNSLSLETSDLSGSHKIYIVSTNRVEIIQIYLALQNAQKIYNIQMSEYEQNVPSSIDIECEITSGFINRTRQKQILRINSQSISIPTDTDSNNSPSDPNSAMQQSAVSSSFKIRDVVSITTKQNDVNCSHRVSITFREGGASGDRSQQSNDVSKEFTIPDVAQLKKFVSYILFSVACSLHDPGQ